MNNDDLEKFGLAWRAVSEYYNLDLTDGALALSFKNLEKFELTAIEQAINRHIQDAVKGQFAPKVADIIQNIEAENHDGRVTGDEAWSIAVQSFDERSTVILNEEIAGALQSARVIYQDGDKVGARMAFRSAYDRLVADARAKGEPVHWWPSLGHDPDGRAGAVAEGIAEGLIGKSAIREIGSAYNPDNPLLQVVKKELKHGEGQ